MVLVRQINGNTDQGFQKQWEGRDAVQDVVPHTRAVAAAGCGTEYFM